MGKVIDIATKWTEEQQQRAAQRGYNRFLMRRHQRQVAQKRQEVLEDERTVE